jgi:hypothetical protein
LHGSKPWTIPDRLSAIAGGCASTLSGQESHSRRGYADSARGSWLTRAYRPKMHLPRPGGWHSRGVQVLFLKPGDFALGSGMSRAAARAALERRFAVRRRIDIVSSIPRPHADGGIHIGTWTECVDGSLFRCSNLPPGMTIEDAQRIVSQPGWKQAPRIPKPGHKRPPLKPEW